MLRFVRPSLVLAVTLVLSVWVAGGKDWGP
jgi:hypothetical protein